MRDKDMHQPIMVLLFGISCFIMGGVVVYCQYAGIFKSWFATIFYLVNFLVFGVLTIMLWMNYWVKIIDDSHFEYSTILGKRTVYRFSQITGRDANNATILLLGDSKIRIFPRAVMSDRLKKALDAALEKTDEPV